MRAGGRWGLVVVMALGCATGTLAAQEDVTCDLPGGNAAIRPALRGGRWSFSEAHRPIGFGIQGDARWFWATSYLGPSGRPPSGDSSDVGWRCQYTPPAALDADSATAWCEGVEGDGVGEVLVLASAWFDDQLGPPPSSSPWRVSGLRIWSGFGKSPALYRANGRPRDLRVTLLRSRPAPRGDSLDVRIADQRVVTLQDVDGWQDVALPAFDVGGGAIDALYLLALELRSVYPGTRYHDTCISAIRPTVR